MDRLRAQQKCVRCESPVPDKRWRCDACVIENREANMRSYQKAKTRGVCPSCRKPWQDDTYITCTKCRGSARAKYAGPKAVRKYESSKWKAVDASKRCGRCFLLEPHVCMYGDASARRAA